MSASTLSALIGYTGFVGSTLLRSKNYDALYNSRNIEEMEGQSFDRVVCAGVSAVKWLANKEPDADWNGIQKLITSLDKIEVDKLILVSTVDVYLAPIGVDEDDKPDTSNLSPYGRHRRMLEEWVTERFSSVAIIRLPALFGEGLKKNIIFDLLNNNMTDKINGDSAFQWYPMRRFASDLELIDASGEKLVNIAVEPIRTSKIADRFFPDITVASHAGSAVLYDVQTNKPELLGGKRKYHIEGDQILSDLESFISKERQ